MVTKNAILSFRGLPRMDGGVYQPNLKVAGYIAVWFKYGKGGGTVGTMRPVGFAADGAAKLVMPIPVP